MINRLAIIELDYHVECLNTLCKVFVSADFEINIFTKIEIASEIRNSCNYDNYRWHVPEKGENVNKFINRNFDQINKCDIILFNTLASNFKIFSKLNFQGKTILRLHNSNSYLAPLKNLKFKLTPYFLYKDFSHIIRLTILQLDWYYRRKCIDKMDYLNFTSQAIEDYANFNNMLVDYKTCSSIPTTCSNLDLPIKEINNDQYFFTVNGTIEEKRRDYKLLFESFKILVPKLDTNITLSFAGRPKGRYAENIIKKFKTLENDKFTFKYFQERIPQLQFDELMQNTDCIIAPINIKTKYTIYKEEYGKTKFSGSVGDIIHYRKIGIVPNSYKINNDQKEYIYQYKNKENLADVILSTIKDKKKIQNHYFRNSDPKIIYDNIFDSFKRITNS